MRLSTLLRPFALPLFLLAFAVPASAQYQVGSIAPGFFDIQTIGTPIPSAVGDDVLSSALTFSTVAPGFTFSFYGAAKTGFKVSSNGVLTFNTALTSISATNPTAVPATAAPNDFVAPFWDDLDAVGGTPPPPAEQVDYYYDSANSRFIIQWTNARRYVDGAGGNLGDLTFQAQLYMSGTIELHYATMTNPGNSYTAAIENAAGTAGTPLFINPATGGVASNTSYRFTLATTPIFAISTRAINFLSAGPCTGLVRNGSIVVTNQGIGTITVSGATLSSPSGAFTLGATQPTYPVTLASGQSATIPLVFSPTAGQTGPQNGSLTITYNDGTAQSVTVALSGSADAEGAGFVFRASTAAVGCENGAAVPGTGFVDITGHTQLTTPVGTGTLDDGFFALNLTTAVPSFGAIRLFGQDRTSLFVNTNNSISFEFGLGGFYGGLPVSGATTIQVGAMDVTFGSNGAVTYDSADPGQFPVGIYYGTRDVDADGDQELVVTWYHSYDFNSPLYNTATPSTARYFTAQLIVYKATRANEEDYYEIRFPDGNDATGTPFRLNTNTVAPTIENDVAVGLNEPLAGESPIYRNGTGLGPGGAGSFYPAGAVGQGVRFQAEAQAIAAGQAGWRMMGAPVQGYTVGRLAGVNLVQSVTGQYPTFPADNLYLDYNGASYVAATEVANAIDPGQGFIWYLFNQNLTPDPAAAGGGTSRSYTLPTRLEGTGAEVNVASGAVSIPLSTAGDKFNLVANPYRDDLDVSTLGSLASGGTLTSAVPQVWDPNVGASGSYVPVSGSVSAWQGFFLQNNTATALNIPTNLRNTTGTFLGLTGNGYTNSRTANPARLAFELAGTDAATGGATVDLAATLVFSETGADGWDLLDASKLAPLANAYATVAFQGELGGTANLKAQESRALDAASFSVPLVVDAVGTAPALTLSWGDLSALPSTWQLSLRDVVTGATVDLRETSSYTFDQAATAARGLSPEALVAQTTVAAQMRASDAARFVLHVTTQNVVATEPGAPTVFALAAPAPNPTASSATIAFDVPEATDVSVAVYDLLGRRVAVLAEGAVAAGRHMARLEAGSLAPGVYVVRMTAGSFAATQRVTVVR